MDKSQFGLVCSGGGAHGAYQVGALKYIHEQFCKDRRSPFQIFTGSSCGSLNTTFYAAESFDAYSARLRLEELWLSFHVPAYHGNLFKNAFKSIFSEWKLPSEDRFSAWALLDPKPMLEVIRKGLNREHLEQALKQNTTRGVAIAATELVSGRVCWFQEGQAARAWNLFHSLGVKDRIQGLHLEASCSVPFFLPPVKIGPHYFIDGSVSLDRPLSAAVAMGASRILVIATDKPIPAELPQYPAGFKPRFSNVIRVVLNKLSHDACMDEAVEIDMFNRFYSALSRKNRRQRGLAAVAMFHEEAMPAHYKPTEIFMISPSRRIREIPILFESQDGNKTKKTRFMFHEKFIRQLINMGYEDSKARHDDLKAFFTPDVKRRRWFFFRRPTKTISPA